MRALGLALILLTAACTNPHCKTGTVRLSYTLSGAVAAADNIEVQLSIGGAAAQTKNVSRKSTDSSIEVDFAQYPKGQQLVFTLTALTGSTVVGSASLTTTAGSSCSALSFTLTAGGSTNDLSLADLAGVDAAAATGDMASLDMAATQFDMARLPDLTAPPLPDLTFVPPPDIAYVQGPSCASFVSAGCGPASNEDCCASPVVSGGDFDRSYDVGTDNLFTNQTHTATISEFRLDRFDVTVGRFRAFAAAGMGTQASPPPMGAGANPYIANSGWDPSWNSSLVPTTAALVTTSGAGVQCNATYQTWTPSAGSNEQRPITCVTWYEAFAFCAWDGGFLPTEAEWNYAAAGGNEQRAFPWSNPPDKVDAGAVNAVFNCGGAPSCTSVTNIGLVGSTSPAGDGKYGQADLAGNVWNWVLDWYVNPYPAGSCVNCANLTAATNRGLRGGCYNCTALTPSLRTADRFDNDPTVRSTNIGIRCARF